MGMRLRCKHPTFLVRLGHRRLETDGLWHRTATLGEEWVSVTEIAAITNASRVELGGLLPPMPGLLLALWPLWLVDPDTGEAAEYCPAGDPRLHVRADQLQGGPTYECILIDHTTVVVQ